MTRGMHTKQQDAVAAAGTEKQFEVGHIVKWSSQAAGSWKEKQGEVIAIIPSGGGRAALRLHGMGAFDSTRKGVSYLVRVPGKTAKSKGTVYWPIASKLQRVV